MFSWLNLKLYYGVPLRKQWISDMDKSVHPLLDSNLNLNVFSTLAIEIFRVYLLYAIFALFKQNLLSKTWLRFVSINFNSVIDPEKCMEGIKTSLEVQGV